MFIYFSCYFDIDQGYSDRFKFFIVQTEASPGKPGSNVKTRSEVGYRFLGSGLKRGLKNHMFYSGKRTEWSPIRSVIVRVITKLDDRKAGESYLLITSMITD